MVKLARPAGNDKVLMSVDELRVSEVTTPIEPVLVISILDIVCVADGKLKVPSLAIEGLAVPPPVNVPPDATVKTYGLGIT